MVASGPSSNYDEADFNHGLLAPDHTLVLVNGKRRHRAAVIAWLGNGIADGSQGPDLSVIPAIALRQVEVLRDGASAQYGSDAIAGVMNFQLKDAPSGGSMEFRIGRHVDANSGDVNTCGILGTSCNGIGGYGKAYAFAGNAGMPLGQNGFANFSLEYGNAEPTNRAIQRNDAAALRAAGNTAVRNPAQVWGAPKVEDDLKIFGNFGYLFNNGLQWYAHSNYATKKVTGGFYFRNPNTRGAVFQGFRLHPISRLNVYDAKGKPTNFPNPDQLDTEKSDHRDAIVYDANGQVASLPGQKGIPSLLIADVLAATGQGSANCPEVAIINNAPDPVAFGQITGDPNCFTFHQPFQGAPDGLPGGFTPQFGGDVDDGVAGHRDSRIHGKRPELGHERELGPEQSRHVHLRHGQRVARSGQPDPLQPQPPAADRCWRESGPLLCRE